MALSPAVGARNGGSAEYSRDTGLSFAHPCRKMKLTFEVIALKKEWK